MQILIGGKPYKCTAYGKILKKRGKGTYKETKDKDGYLKYHIRDCETNKTHNLMVHRVVWEAFNGAIPDGLTIDHKDSDKQNNNISNLQLLTAKENAVKGNARNWLAISPSGEEFAVYNLEQFCRDNSLHSAHMRGVAKGKLRQYKGWICYER